MDKKKNSKLQFRETVEIERVHFNDSSLHLSFLHRIKNRWLQLLITLIVSLVFAFVGLVMIQNSGLYGLGVDAISHGFGRMVGFLIQNKTHDIELAKLVFVILFWGINSLINVPLIIFSYFKINKSFALYTMLFNFSSAIFGILINFIPGSDSWSLFGQVLNENIVDNTHGIVQVSLWVAVDAHKHVPLILYSILWAIIQGIIASVMFLISASSGGFDMVIVWFGRIKYKSLSVYLFIFHLISLNLANLVGTYIPVSETIMGDPSIVNIKPWEPQIFFNTDYAAGFIMVLVNALIVDFLFPKYKLVKVEIISKKISEIRDAIYALKDQRFATSIMTVEGGYSGHEHRVLSTNCFYIDSHIIIEITQNIDPEAFVTISPIKKANSYMFVSYQTNKHNDKKRKK